MHVKIKVYDKNEDLPVLYLIWQSGENIQKYGDYVNTKRKKQINCHKIKC